MNNNFWKNKKVLITGHTGFKGSWLALWLTSIGADVTGLALPMPSPNLFSLAKIDNDCNSILGDIRDESLVQNIIATGKFEIVFHLAAQSLVRASYADPLETFSTNIIGTTNILNALRKSPATKVAIVITTDKVYENNEWVWPYRENDTLGGHDPYSASKAACEIIVTSYKKSFLEKQGVAIASARAGNVIGGGDWAKDRLIPDAIRAWNSGNTLVIRRPDSIRPWQHVLDPLFGYLTLAEKIWYDPKLAGPYNFGPDFNSAVSVRNVIDLCLKFYGKGKVVFEDGLTGPHEAGILSLDTAKARKLLNFYPRLTLDDSIEKTITWYKQLSNGLPPKELCLDQINAYKKNFPSEILPK